MAPQPQRNEDHHGDHCDCVDHCEHVQHVQHDYPEDHDPMHIAR